MSDIERIEINLNRLIIARLRAGLTQAELGERAGVHRRTIMALENGQRRPRLRTIHSIAKALDLDPVELTRRGAA